MPKYHKDLRVLLAELAAEGWQDEGHTGKTHIKLRHTTGALVFLAGTPSDRRALKNARAAARRALAAGPRH